MPENTNPSKNLEPTELVSHQFDVEPQGFRNIGRHLFMGFIDQLWIFAPVILLAVLVAILFRNICGIGVDDSDLDGWHRSGMKVMTDHKTGIQYLSDGHGGMVRREFK